MTGMLDSFAPDVDLEKELAAEPAPTEAPTEAPVQEPTQAPTAAPTEAPKQEQPHKMVPLAALHEERMRRQELQNQIKSFQEQINQLKSPPPPVPDFNVDPANNLRHETEQTKAKLAQIEQEVLQSRQEREARVFEQQVATSTQAAEQLFAKDHPDYVEAVKHLQGIADKNLQLMGLDDPAARQAQIRQDALGMSLKALQAGKNPAEVAYQLAVNYGYKAAEPKAAEGTDPAKKIATLQAGAQASVSMPSGGTKPSTLTLASIEQMDDEEFAKMIDDPVQWKKLISQV